MGQHKHNPTAKAAKCGLLPPKPEKMSKREIERRLYAECTRLLFAHFLENTRKPDGVVSDE